jgi:hypothetical protein
MYTKIDNILREVRLKVGKLFDMYKTYAEKSIYFLNAHVFGHFKAKNYSLRTGHNLAGGVGRWKHWGGGHIFFSQEKGRFIKY